MKRLLAYALLTLAVMGGLAYAGYAYTHYYDPGRVWYKRMKADNKYVFDEIPPKIAKVDAGKLISLRSDQAVQDRRKALAALYFRDPETLTASLPKVEEIESDRYGIAEGQDLALVERLETEVALPGDPNYHAFYYHFRPQNWNGRVVQYHNGYASNIGAQKKLIRRLLGEGFAVVAHNFPGYGEQFPRNFTHDRFGRVSLGYDAQMDFIDHALRIYLQPVFAANNHLRQRHGVEEINLIGFSAGGWIATLTAAADTRLTNTISIAGVYPIYVRPNATGNERPRVHYYPPFLQTTNYLDAFVAAASGEGRNYTQIFNRYDRCCYRNRYGKLYESDVADAVAEVGAGGQFQVLLDETHADHRISDWSVQRILEILK